MKQLLLASALTTLTLAAAQAADTVVYEPSIETPAIQIMIGPDFMLVHRLDMDGENLISTSI